MLLCGLHVSSLYKTKAVIYSWILKISSLFSVNYRTTPLSPLPPTPFGTSFSPSRLSISITLSSQTKARSSLSLSPFYPHLHLPHQLTQPYVEDPNRHMPNLIDLTKPTLLVVRSQAHGQKSHKGGYVVTQLMAILAHGNVVHLTSNS